MDTQIHWLGWIPIIKDWLTLIVAAVGVCIAWKGLRTWQRQLKGSSQFDVAKRLMLKVYQIRQDIEFCRESYRSIPLLTHYKDGKPIPQSEQERYSSNREMWDRYNVVAKTRNEIEFILFESEIILDKNVREVFQPVEDICYILRHAINEHIIIVCDPQYKNMSKNEESYNEYIESLRVIYSREDDDIQIKINSAVAEFEKVIRPYIHG